MFYYQRQQTEPVPLGFYNLEVTCRALEPGEQYLLYILSKPRHQQPFQVFNFQEYIPQGKGYENLLTFTSLCHISFKLEKWKFCILTKLIIIFSNTDVCHIVILYARRQTCDRYKHTKHLIYPDKLQYHILYLPISRLVSTNRSQTECW